MVWDGGARRRAGMVQTSWGTRPRAAQNVDQLVGDHVLDSLTGRLQVLARVKVRRMQREVLADRSGDRQTDVGVDVDLADSALGSLAEHFLRDADRVRHRAAVLVDLINKFLRNGRRAVQNDRELRQTAGNLFQNVEAELRLLAGLELVSAVGGADRDRQRVNAGAGYEILNLRRIGVLVILSLNVVLNAGELAQLSFYDNAVCVRILSNLLCDLDVLLVRHRGAVEHNRGKAAVDAVLAELEGVAVVQMQRDRDIRALDYSSLNHLEQIGVVRVSARALGYLKDNRSLLLLAGLSDTLNDLHIVHVESADGVAAVVGFLEHLGRSN